jgi:hypothetical protein
LKLAADLLQHHCERVLLPLEKPLEMLKFLFGATPFVLKIKVAWIHQKDCLLL